MRKILFMINLTLMFYYCQSQNNWVKNPGFENPAISSSPGNCPAVGCGHITCYSTEINYWQTNSNDWTIPKERNVCLRDNVGSPDVILNDAHTGNNSGRTFEVEYIVQPLTANLTINHLYYIEFFIKSTNNVTSSNASTWGGIKFFKKQPRQCGFHPLKEKPIEPNIRIPTNFYDQNWHKISGYWEAKVGYSWLCMGEIRKNIGSFGMLWDDFKIFDVGPAVCPTNNFIQNTTFQDVDGLIYRSQLLTASGNHVDPNLLVPVGDVHVTNTAGVIYKSATEVALMPGFHADLGCSFDAIIAPCNLSPCPVPSAEIGADDEYCNMAYQQIQLGGPSSGNETYQWTTTGQGGVPLNVLNSTTISDPMLTIPSGSGAIDITEVATSGCDGSTSTDQETIFYDDNPNLNPAISASPSGLTANPPSSVTANFTIQGDAHTEEVYIAFYDDNSGSPILIDEDVIDNFPNMSNSSYQYNYSYTYPTFDKCKKYHFEIKSKNICSNNISPIATVNWASPVGQGIGSVTSSAYVCKWSVPMQIYASSITWYNILVYDSWGSLVYSGSGNPSGASPFPVFWGNCNASSCSSNQVSDGTYYYFISLQNCAGVNWSSSGNVCTVVGGCRVENPNDTTLNNGSNGGVQLNPQEIKSGGDVANNITSPDFNSLAMKVYPNPAKDLLNVNFDNTTFTDNKISLFEIYDYAGNIVYRKDNAGQNNEVDLSNFANGIYSVITRSEKQTMRKSFIIQR